MKIRVLGCAGTVSTESKTSAFLVNERVLLDGGTICSTLSIEELYNLKNIFISHPHFDHIKGLPSLAETLIFMNDPDPVTIYGSEISLNAIRQHIMNGVIWPDFSKLPTKESPVIRYSPLQEKQAVKVEGVTFTPWFLYHNDSDFGYLLDNGESTLLYTSDIGPDAELCVDGKIPDSIIIEVSFPNQNRELALMSGHLTPMLLLEMLEKLPKLPKNIYVAHLKTYFKEEIITQLKSLGLNNIIILQDGDILNL